MTMEELLNLPALARLRVVAGRSGLGRKVSSVSVMDAPDIYKWMRGGEFLITSAYAVKDDAEYLTQLIEKLDRANVAAFGVKVERFLGALPRNTLDTADRLGLPLIFIPEDYAFIDIINPTLQAILDQQTARLEQAEKIHTAFLEIAMSAQGAGEIVRVLSEMIARPVVFADLVFRKVFSSGRPAALEQIEQAVRDGGDPPALGDRFELHRVGRGKACYGYLLMEKRPEKKVLNYSTAVEYAGIVLTLDIQTRISNSRIEEKYREEFLGDLIYNNIKSEEEIHNRARLYGWNFENGGLIVIVDVNNIKQVYRHNFDKSSDSAVEYSVQTVFEISHTCMARLFPQVKYYKLSDHIVYLLSCSAAQRRRLSANLEEAFARMRREAAAHTHNPISMGIGSYRSNIKDIHESYEEAKTAIALGARLHLHGCTLFYEQLGFYRLLVPMQNTREAQKFTETYILPLAEYDRAHHTNLLETLEQITRCGWNLQQSARELFIHYNTMKYRFAKIEEILSVDLRKHEQQFNVELALGLYHVAK